MRSKNWRTTWTPQRLLALAPLAALVAAALVLAGCGGGSSGGEESTTASRESTSAGAGGAGSGPGGFEISDEDRACLEEKGVELPEPGEGAGPPEGFQGGKPPEGFQPPEGGEPPKGFEGGGFDKRAFEECGIRLQGKPGGPQANSAQFKEQIEEYVACVRRQGYDLPEPNFSGEGPVFSESEVDQSDPKFKEASEACQSRLSPARNGG
jgi:hypothetical protein